MAEVISIHSFRGGTGKSNITANLATAIASKGKRVAVIDADLQSPNIHILFGMEQVDSKMTLNQYLWGNYSIEQVAHDITADSVRQKGGNVFLVPSSHDVDDITRILQYGYDVRLLKKGFNRLIEALTLDYVLVDTHSGLNEETLLCIPASKTLVVVLRLDGQDLQGTTVMIGLAQKLNVSRILMVVNQAMQYANAETIEIVKHKLQDKYGVPVVGVLPNCEEMMQLFNTELFSLRYPDHVLTQTYQQVAHEIMDS